MDNTPNKPREVDKPSSITFAVDQSKTCCGLVAIGDVGGTDVALLHAHALTAPSKVKAADKLGWYFNELVNRLSVGMEREQRTFVREGYLTGKHEARIAEAGEMGGVFAAAVACWHPDAKWGSNIFALPPQTWRKYITGSGKPIVPSDVKRKKPEVYIKALVEAMVRQDYVASVVLEQLDALPVAWQKTDVWDAYAMALMGRDVREILEGRLMLHDLKRHQLEAVIDDKKRKKKGVTLGDIQELPHNEQLALVKRFDK